MAIEKGLYSAPEGLDKELQEGLEGVEGMDTTELEIEIIDPEAVTLSDGSMEITLIPDLNESDLMGFDGNLAEALDDGDLQELSSELIGLVEADMETIVALIDRVLVDHTNEDVIEQVASEVNEMMSERAIFVF